MGLLGVVESLLVQGPEIRVCGQASVTSNCQLIVRGIRVFSSTKPRGDGPHLYGLFQSFNYRILFSWFMQVRGISVGFHSVGFVSLELSNQVLNYD